MRLWPWIVASVVIHGLIVMGLFISWPDNEEVYSEGFVSIELIQAIPGKAVEKSPKTNISSLTHLSKHIESASKQPVSSELKLTQKTAEVAPAPDSEAGKEVAAKPEEKLVSNILASNQERMEAQQAQSQKKWKRVRARLEESKWYPASARRRGIEGDVELGFALNREGYTRYATVLTGSGYATLDQAALETIKRAEPFPADGGEYRFKLRFRRL
jgi:protein TonB